jgi:sugar phosphate isomerase/epimerase
MTTYSRRTFGHLLAAGIPLLMSAGVSPPARARVKNPRIDGVKFGVMAFSFFADMKKLPQTGRVDPMIRAMTSLGVYDLELQPDDIVPGRLGLLFPGRSNPKAKEWYDEQPLSYFEGVRRKFNDAGINIECYMGADWETDRELGREFLIANALGARFLGRPAGLPRIRRMARAAEKQNFPIYVHNETEGPDYLLQAMAVSPIVRINFDTGNYTKFGYPDELGFIKAHHDRISHFHLKDAKRNGPYTLFGQGDTPVKDILLLLRDNHWDTGCFIENEVGFIDFFKGRPLAVPTVAALRQAVDYMKHVLASSASPTSSAASRPRAGSRSPQILAMR